MTTTTTTKLADAELAAEYVSWCAERKRLRPNTVGIYRDTVNHLLRWLDGRPLAEVDADDIEAFARRPRRFGVMPKATTSSRDVTILRGFFSWAQRRGKLPPSDVADAVSPKLTSRIPKPIDDQVWRRVWCAELAPDDRLWLGLGYFAGLRRFEIASMPPEAVDARNGVLHLNDRKGGSQAAVEYRDMCQIVETEIPWVTEGWEAWAELLERRAVQRAGERHLWPHAVGDSNVDVAYFNRHLRRRILPAAGLSMDAFTPHHLRHSCATNLLRAGVQATVIADLLSHASVTTTMRYMLSSGQLGRILNERKKAR